MKVCFHLLAISFLLMANLLISCGSGNDLQCAVGTHEENGACMPDYPEIDCGEGVHEEDGVCIPDYEEIVCGEGSHEENGECVADYEEIVCGEGSYEQDGKCVPSYEEIVCGEGSHEEDGECIPDYEEVVCGPDTVFVDGECVLEEPKITCGDGTVVRGESCVPLSDQWVNLPFPQGVTYSISQGYHAYFTHNHENNSSYAIDFVMDEGEEIAAARGGKVIYVKEDSNNGCAEASCVDDANMIQIDHGDGTIATYAHLQLNGADVAFGDTICTGQIIGRSGNTGYSTGPHLHFDIRDLYFQTLPIKFIEFENRTRGWPVAGMTAESENVAPTSCEQDTEFSFCPEDTFAFMGILLDSGFPCAVAKIDWFYPISGVSMLGEGMVYISLYNSREDTWQDTCVEIDESGAFATNIRWSSSIHGGYSLLMIGTADEQCSSVQSWEFAIPIRLVSWD